MTRSMLDGSRRCRNAEHETLESRVHRKVDARFGGGPSEKYHSPGWQLVGGLPNPSPQELWAAGLYAREVRNSQGLLGGGLDVRGEGGYVVAPPSSTARAYRWIDRSPPAGASWLLGCLKAATSGETLF